MGKTTVLYDEDHNPNKEGTSYVAIDTNRVPPYIMETYSLARGQIDGIRYASPDSVLIEDLDIARKLFDFKEDKIYQHEFESEIDHLNTKIIEDEAYKKWHSNLAIVSSMPLIYLFSKELYDIIENGSPVDFTEPVHLLVGMGLGAFFTSSIYRGINKRKRIEKNKHKINDLESQLMDKFLGNNNSE